MDTLFQRALNLLQINWTYDLNSSSGKSFEALDSWISLSPKAPVAVKVQLPDHEGDHFHATKCKEQYAFWSKSYACYTEAVFQEDSQANDP
jgi:hypothetical protein